MSDMGIKNIWDIQAGGGSNVDTTNLAKKNEENTFTANQNINGTGDVLTIKRTNNESFGMDFKKEDDERIGYIGTSQASPNTATVWGKNGLVLQATDSLIKINGGNGDFQWESATSRTWANNVDNTITRTKDFKYVKFFDKINDIPQTTNEWKTNFSWPLPGINTEGLHEVLILISINNVVFSLNTKIVWKSGLNESKSQFCTISDGANEWYFQLVIRNNNQFQIYHKKDGNTGTMQWIRGWVIRGGNLPWKMDQLW